MASCGTFQKLSPLSLLSHLSSSYDSAQLRVFSESVSWSIYLEEGKIIYASHSIAPFDRLDCHLHRLGHQVPSLTSEVRAQLSLIFETDTTDTQSMLVREYQAISWLVNHQYLTTDLAAQLIAGLVQEVIESFLLVKTGKYEFGKIGDDVPGFCQLDLQPIINECQQRLQGWKFLGPQVWSPYQRLYFSNRHKIETEVAPEVQQKLGAILKGFSFRHLAVLLNQDELQLANSLYQYIVDGTILLQDPYPPFDRLPKTFEELDRDRNATIQLDETPQLPISNITDRHISDRHLASPPKAFNSNSSVQSPQFLPATQKNTYSDIKRSEELVERTSDYESSPPKLDREEPRSDSFSAEPITPSVTNSRSDSTKPAEPIPNKSTLNTYPAKSAEPISERSFTDRSYRAIADPILDASIAKRTYKIVCVDDSPAILQELHRCLEDEIFSVHTINNPIKALMQIIKVKPDLILLDVNMAGIDGYELCRLLRNHSVFKNTPIIMVTANTGLINRVKARIVGASGYLTKPFTQPDLLKIVFRYLT